MPSGRVNQKASGARAHFPTTKLGLARRTRTKVFRLKATKPLILFSLLLLPSLLVQFQFLPSVQAKTDEVHSINTIEEKTSANQSSSPVTITDTSIIPTTGYPLEESSKFTQLFVKLRQAFSTTPEVPSSKSSPTSPPTVTTPTSTTSNLPLPVGNDEHDGDENEQLGGSEFTGCNTTDCVDLLDGDEAKRGNLSDVERLVKLQGYIQERVKERLKSATRSSLQLFDKLSLTGGCSASLMNLMSSMMQIKSYAFKFVDASAKIPSGVMYGLLSDFGDFDQCLAIRTSPNVALEDEAEEGSYSGKYCLLSVKLNYKIKLDNDSMVPEGIQADGILWDELIRNYWTSNSTKGFQVGVCLPSRCTDDDIQQIYQQFAIDYNFKGEIIACQDGLDLKRQHQPDLVQRLIIHAFHFLLALIIVGTLVDRYNDKSGTSKRDNLQPSEQSNANRSWLTRVPAYLVDLELLACFSVARSWRMFMGAKQNYPGLSQQPWDGLTASNSAGCSLDQINKSSNPTTTTGQSNSKLIDSNCAIETAEETNRLCRELSIRIQSSDSMRNSGYLLSSLSVETEVEEDQENWLSHLSGLKLFVILWITSGHSFLYPSANNYQYYRSIINMNITRDSVWFATTNFTLGIDMLLYMTGLVFVYKLAHLTHRKSTRHAYEGPPKSSETTSSRGNTRWLQNFSLILRFVIKKILRFWPTYLTLIALAIVVPLFSDGPMWPEMISKRIGQSCRRNWWSNLLFVNNYFLSESEICLPSSWFISVLMQLFLVGSIIVVIIRKYSLKMGISVIGMLLITSINVTFSMVYLKGLQAPVIRMDETFVMEMDDNIFKMYTSLLNNLGPFLMGMLGGLLLIYRQVSVKNANLHSGNRSTREQQPSAKSKKRHLEKSISFLGELLVGLLVLSIAIGVLSSVFYNNYSRLNSAIYWSCHRVGWAIVTGYIIHQCATNKWRLLKEILSLSTFVPLSKLIFIAYLIHPILIHIHSGLVRDGLHVSIYNMMNIYITRLFMTFALALVVHLLVELPLCSVEEILLQRWLKGSSKKGQTEERASPSIRKFLPLLIVAPASAQQFDENRKSSDKNILSRGDSSVELIKSKFSEDSDSANQTREKKTLA